MSITQQETEMLTVVLESCACTTLRKASRVVTSFFDQAFEPTGLKSTQLSVLLATAVHGPTTIRNLADVTVMDPSSLSRALPRLEQLGYISKAVGESKRSRMVEVTEEGMEVIRQAGPMWEKAQAVFQAQLGQENTPMLLSMLHSTLKLQEPAAEGSKAGVNGNGSALPMANGLG